MKLLILSTLIIKLVTPAIIDEKLSLSSLSSTAEWPTASDLINLIDQEQYLNALDTNLNGNLLNLNAAIPRCRPVTVTKRKGVTYTTTLRPRPSTVQVTLTITEGPEPTATVTSFATVTETQTATTILTRYKSPPDTHTPFSLKSAQRVPTDDGTCIYVGDVTGGYDVLPIVADLFSQVLAVMQLYIDKRSPILNFNQAATAEAFVFLLRNLLPTENELPPSSPSPPRENAAPPTTDHKPSLDPSLTDLGDTVVSILHQMGVTDFDPFLQVLNDTPFLSSALAKAGLSTTSKTTQGEGERELQEVLNQIGLPGLLNLKDFVHRLLEKPGENSLTDNLEEALKAYKKKQSVVGGTVAVRDYHEDDDQLFASYNRTMMEEARKRLTPGLTKAKLEKGIERTAKAVLTKEERLEDIIPEVVQLYFRMFEEAGNGGPLF